VEPSGQEMIFDETSSAEVPRRSLASPAHRRVCQTRLPARMKPGFVSSVVKVVRALTTAWEPAASRPRGGMYQAARRWTSQMVAAMSSADSVSSQPPSIHWKGQNRLAGW
jgi:hypothetical protein